MRVIFDHNVPKRLRRFLSGHDVRTAQEMSWAELENGDLLHEAEEAGFQVMLTGDKKIAYQQNLTGRKLALIVLETNDWNVIKENSAPVVSAVNRATPGSFQRIAFEGPAKTRRSTP